MTIEKYCEAYKIASANSKYMCTLQVCWIESPPPPTGKQCFFCFLFFLAGQLNVNQHCVNSPHISSNINATAELSEFTNGRDLQLAKFVHIEVLSDNWLAAKASGISLCSLQFHFNNLDPVKTSKLMPVHKVRNKDLVLPLGMDRGFLLEWHF